MNLSVGRDVSHKRYGDTVVSWLDFFLVEVNGDFGDISLKFGHYVLPGSGQRAS